MKHPDLFTPLQIGSLTLKNRIVMSPLTRGRAGLSRIPNDLMATYYRQRCDAGLIISEETAISDQGYGWFGAPACYTVEHMKGWRNVVSSVHENNSKIFLQLWHMGRQGHPSYTRDGDVVAPSPINVPGSSKTKDIFYQDADYVIPRELHTTEVPQIVNDFKRSSILAKEAGFDGVEIHGANGYLIDTFLQKDTNLREDDYGGTWEKRVRFLNEIIESIKDIFEPNRIGVKLSPNSSFAGMGHKENKEFFPFVARRLKEHKIGYLHVVDGLDLGFHNLCPPVQLQEMKSNFEGTIVGNGGFTKELANGALRSGAADLISFGRPFINNPDLPQRFLNNYPLAPEAPIEHWYGKSPYISEQAIGYTDYIPYDAKE